MESSPTKTFDTPLPLRCRPDQSNWVLIIFFGIFGMMSMFFPSIDAHSEHPSSDPWAVWLLALMGVAVFLLPALLGAVWICRACIIADVVGLRWRGLFGSWRSALWSEVTDYYEGLKSQRSSYPHFMIVETQAGRIKFDKDWSDVASLRAVLQSNATQARVDQWGVLGTRPEDDWPRVFTYQSQQSRWETGIISSLFLTSLGYCLWQFFPEMLKRYEQDNILWDVLPMAVLLLLMTAGVALVIGMFVEQSKSITKRLNQRIVVDPKSITYEEGGEKATFAWKEITDYYIHHAGGWRPGVEYVIKTASGDIRFSLLLKDAMLLKAIVQRYVTATNGKDWRYAQDPNTLGGVAAKWSGGREGVGQRIYHYRTGLNRAGLFALIAFAVSLLLAIGIERQYEIAPLNNAPAGIHFADALVLLYVWSLWRYRAAQIRTDAAGVWQYTVLGRRFLVWGDVQDYYLTGPEGDFGNVVGADGSRIRFWTSIADIEELKEEIAQRAVHCQGQAWGKKERRAAVVNQ